MLHYLYECVSMFCKLHVASHIRLHGDSQDITVGSHIRLHGDSQDITVASHLSKHVGTRGYSDN